MSEATTVHVKNISSQTSQDQVKDFFSFCGKIANISVSKDGDSQSAAVTFEKPTAAKTALLLDNTQLGPNLVHVSSAASLEELSSPKTTGPHDESAEDVPQEDKPRSRIVAEYLAHGYTISDTAIERAIKLDQQHGFSSRFTQALSNFDQKYQASDKAKAVDAKYGLSEKAGQGYRTFNSYFEKTMNTPSGQKLRGYYTSTSKQVVDVHNEARRLADLKTGKPSDSATSPTSASAPGATTAQAQQLTHGELAEKMNMEKIPGTETTKCTCGGADGTCPCEPGACRCASCGKNPEATKAGEATHNVTSSTPATQ